LWLYDVARDSITVLDRGPFGFWGGRPQFLDGRTITFVRQWKKTLIYGADSLYEMDLVSHRVKEILRLPVDIHSYAWNNDRTMLVYEVSSPFIDDKGGRQPTGGTALCIYDARNGAIKRIKTLDFIPGGGGSEADDLRLTWSPAATSILALDTYQARTPLHVVDTAGRDVVPARDATFARWIDSHTILFREQGSFHRGELRNGRWFRLNVETGDVEAFPMPAGSRPMISPDGRRIAFDDANTEEPSTYVYDRASGKTHLVARGYGAPIWLSNDVIAVTAGGQCPAHTECNDWWTPLGKTIAVDLNAGTRRALRLSTTGPFPFDMTNVDVLLAS